MRFKSAVIYVLVFTLCKLPFVHAQSQSINSVQIPKALLSVSAQFNSSADKMDLFRKFFSNRPKSDQIFLSQELKKLQKISFPDVTLSAEDTLLIPFDEKKIEFQVVDAENAIFKINKSLVKLPVENSLEKNLQKIETILKSTMQVSNSKISFLLPQAHAAVGLIIAGGVWLVGFLSLAFLQEMRDENFGIAEKLMPCREKIEDLKSAGITPETVKEFPTNLSEKLKATCPMYIKGVEGYNKKGSSEIEGYFTGYTDVDSYCANGLIYNHCIDELNAYYEAAKSKPKGSISSSKLSQIGDYLVKVSKNEPKAEMKLKGVK